jgi:site-specific recombinase XerD
MWMNEGNFIHAFEGMYTSKSLREHTIVGYTSSLRKYLETIHNNLRTTKKFSGERKNICVKMPHIEKKKKGTHDKQPTLEALIVYSYRISTIMAFINNMKKNDFQPKTINNYCSMLMWFLAFLRQLSHPEVNPSRFNDIRKDIRKSLFSKNLSVC